VYLFCRAVLTPAAMALSFFACVCTGVHVCVSVTRVCALMLSSLSRLITCAVKGLGKTQTLNPN
jgi:hypothetical protein